MIWPSVSIYRNMHTSFALSFVQHDFSKHTDLRLKVVPPDYLKLVTGAKKPGKPWMTLQGSLLPEVCFACSKNLTNQKDAERSFRVSRHKWFWGSPGLGEFSWDSDRLFSWAEFDSDSLFELNFPWCLWTEATLLRALPSILGLMAAAWLRFRAVLPCAVISSFFLPSLPKFTAATVRCLLSQVLFYIQDGSRI